eukprot:GHVS01028260.1.p1 GENE.GHVS01028260.1~~GHVS01028260.1.p1  ORF type:complete len:244 (-),score=53.42 GHVS01028260.1:1571-2302(-)
MASSSSSPPSTTTTAEVNPFMEAAISCAIVGITEEHGGPFGACITRGGSILSVAHNCVLTSLDPCAHAEMECIRKAAREIRSHDLSECELYTTCDPCPMCWGACQWSRIKKVHIGAERSIAAQFGFDDAVFFEELTLPYKERVCAGHTGVREAQVEEELIKPSTTYRRRLCRGDGQLATVYEAFFLDDEETRWKSPNVCDQTEYFMKEAVAIAKESKESGHSRNNEPFGAVIVTDEGKIVAGQ